MVPLRLLFGLFAVVAVLASGRRDPGNLQAELGPLVVKANEANTFQNRGNHVIVQPIIMQDVYQT